ncbi:Gfo/Idh/MocA family oxidoreductase [Actinocorallia sp. API 0066]|uniref:Gfo/Idh/MocA family protein n=1 Tax=Actinocorallia sp. API 0066 TaxID=2896846 RepID=UPI001E5377AE|nr:Gfo/Idh/MocA family oxidoreductase [Actinocorallia sp. API 0066]MCD0451474.1 Gfo/Idh/MocA family oxidoreductase [Actinocorallia sp. API 0066]
MRPHRIAVAGCGAAAFGLHLPVLTASPAWTVTAVLDRHTARAHAAAGRFGVPAVAHTLPELLDGADMIAVTTGVHHTLIEEAVKAGTHVFTEKPVTLDPAYSARLHAQARDAGVLLEVGTVRLYDPAVRALRDRLLSPNGGWLVKADGVDAAARAHILPDGFATYTFADDPPQPVPDGLEPHQEEALKVLLWEGYHQLTALLAVVGSVYPAACAIGPDRAVHATATDDHGQPYTIVVARPGGGVFVESFHLTGDDSAADLSWPAPYSGPPDPFAAMWGAIADALDSGVPTGSAAFAQRVEELALGLARTATSLGSTHG